jgi:hypothetical protein
MNRKNISVILIFVILFCTTGCTGAFTRLPSTPLKSNKQRIFTSDILPPPPALEPGEISVGKAVSMLKKGQTAPFSGVLLSPEAVADLITRLESYNSECQLKIDKELAIQKANTDLKYAQLSITHDTYKNNCQIKLSSRDDTIKLLNKTLEKNTDPKTEWWFVGGVAGGFILGTVITVATVYATSEAFK